jgi:phosphate-selective porin OprO/OprP
MLEYIKADDRRDARLPGFLRARRVAIVTLTSLVIALPSVGLAAESPAIGELEEPGEIERLPPGESASLPKLDAGDPPQKGDPAPEAESANPLDAEETHEDEAIEILPDSEAIDETIVDEKPKEDPPDQPQDKEPAGPKEAPTPAPAPEQAKPPEHRWTIRWQNAFIVERVDDPSYQFLFGGRAQNDWGAYIPDNDLKRDFGDDGTGTKFRRARIYFQGQFFRLGFFKAEYDFSNSEGTDFTDVYAGISIPGIGLFLIGHSKEPFSLQYQNSSNFASFNERAGIQAFSPARNTGIMLNGNFLARDSTYSIGFFRRTDDVGEGFSNNEDYRITSRFTGLPLYEDGGAKLVHIEFGYSHQFADQNEGTQYAYMPGSDFAPNVVDTGILPVSDVELFNLGVAVVNGPLAFQAEASLSVPHDGINENPVFWGAYGEISWWITGERKRYLRGRGVFSRVVPQNRFNPEKGDWGGFELAMRLSWLDLSNGGIRGGTLGEWTAGLNWVLFSNLRMSNNYVLSHTGDRPGLDSGFAHTWLTRFQIDF